MVLPSRPAGAGPLAVARRYAARPATWSKLVRYDVDERFYTRVGGTPDHEVWLLTWLPGQGTDLHDHGGCAGAFTVVSGVLVEETVLGGRLRPRRLSAGSGRAFGPRHVHRVTNSAGRPAVSLHVYRPALRRMNRYELLPTGALRRVEVTRAGAQW
jgi:mannose-6-phosphate isomerase-like protein (cupin superfamily)